MAAKFISIWARNKMAIKKTHFFIYGSELLNLLILYDLGAKTNISDVYCSSSDLYFIVKSKMDVVLDIYY